MEVDDSVEMSIHSPQRQPAQTEFGPTFIAGMSNPELLRFGVSTRFRCLQAENPNDPRMKNMLLHLNLARAEWNRRHPQLPLRDSF